MHQCCGMCGTGTAMLFVSSTTWSGDYCNFPNTKKMWSLPFQPHVPFRISTDWQWTQIHAALLDIVRHFMRRNTTLVKVETIRLSKAKEKDLERSKKICASRTFASSCRSLPPQMFSSRFSLLCSFCVFSQYADYSYPCSSYCVWT